MSQGTITLNMFDRLALTFGRALKAAPPQPGALYPPNRGGGASYPISFPGWEEWYRQYGGNAGQRDEATAKIAVGSPWVFRGVQAIANEVSTSTVVVKRRAGDAGDEDIENHPFEQLWEKPNPFFGRGNLMMFWAWQLVLSGEAYLYMRPVNGQLTEIWPIPSWMIEPIPDAQQFISGYVFRSGESDRATRIDSRFICYSRLPHPFDPRRGLSPLVALMTDVEGDLGMGRWNKNFFSKENAAPEGMISVPATMEDADIARVRQEISDFFSSGARRVAVARAGDLTWTAFGRSQKDMEFLEGRRFTAGLVDTVLGIPEGYWSKDATRANSEGAKATFIENAIWPKLVMLAEDLNSQVMPLWYGADERATFDDIRPRNRATELAEFGALVPVLTVNELRSRYDYDALPDSDPRGAMFVAEITKGAPLPATPASAITEDALAAQEAEAGVDAAEAAPEGAGEAMDAAPTDDALPPADDAPEDVAALKAAERRAWQRKALNKGPAARFETKHLTDDEARQIRDALAGATDATAIKAAFAVKAQDIEALIDGEWAPAIKWARIAMKEGE
jgi:HK97 family phage portal protein